jgi:capsular polysaccharide biosynthesis protein
VDLNRYLRTLVRFFWLPLLLGALGAAAAVSYQQAYGLDSAEATVAVLDPQTARPGAYIEAQVTFDAVIRSRELAERVARRVDEQAADVQGRLSITVVAPASSVANPSPLYAVRGKDRGSDRAVRLVNVAVEEARALYVEHNAADGSKVRLLLDRERAQASAQLDQARKALTDFAKANGADLRDRVGIERATTEGLKQRLRDDEVQEAIAINSDPPNKSLYNALLAADRRLNGELATEQAELSRLEALEQQYDGLTFNVSEAQSRISQLAQMEQTMVAGQLVPAGSQVKLLDQAVPQGQFLAVALEYLVAAVTGVLVGLAAVYGVALVRRPVQTSEDVRDAFGAPVLVRLPKSAS